MDENKKLFESEKAKLIEFTQSILDSLAEKNPDYATISPKNCLFRQNRDVRFSKNKDPYKTNFGIVINLAGKKSPKASFYIHIAETGSFVGGGMWMPEASLLKKIRQEIDYNWADFKALLSEPKFISVYGDLNQNEKLVRPPKDYAVDNPAIEYLKLKSFTATRPLSDKIIQSDNLASECLKAFSALEPMLDFLNQNVE